MTNDATLPISYSGNDQSICADGEPLRYKTILTENYPFQLFPPESHGGLLKCTSVKNQAERQPHLRIHWVSRVTATSIKPWRSGRKCDMPF